MSPLTQIVGYDALYRRLHLIEFPSETDPCLSLSGTGSSGIIGNIGGSSPTSPNAFNCTDCMCLFPCVVLMVLPALIHCCALYWMVWPVDLACVFLRGCVHFNWKRSPSTFGIFPVGHFNI
eukprot:308055_1